jgi:diguanylate cyclase (GGDEF)-like protein
MSKPTAQINRPNSSAVTASRALGTLVTGGLLAVVLCLAALVPLTSAGGSPVRVVALLAAAALGVGVAWLSIRLQSARAELARQRAELEDLASIDHLTGTCNRRAFQRELERHFRPGAELALMLIDLDDLKSVNDSLGHAVGDAILQGTARRIQDCLRSTDVVSRLSGDEFAVLLPRVDPAAVEVIARRIVEAAQRPHPAELHSCTVGVSVGVVLHSGETSAGELLRNADVALMAAKRDGKGHHVLYRPELHASQVERIAFERDLRTALEQDQFVLFYQPMVDSKSRRILGVEALVRWNHPERGMVPPLDFLPMAEATGLIIPLGAWVLREACRQTQRWRAGNPGLFEDFVVSVNVSARQLFGTQLQDDVLSALDESGLDPRHLVLEIIESQVMTDLRAALRQFATLKELGVRIAIDDFGSGYSSLGHLQELPVDFLKLDKSFTDNIAHSVKSQELMRTVAQLSRTLSISTVAEGVETLEQADLLHALDVNLCQGYFFARPIDASSTGRLLRRVSHLPERPTRPSAAAGGRLSVRVPRSVRAATSRLSN